MNLDAWTKYGFSKVTLLTRNRHGVIVDREQLDPDSIKPLIDCGKQLEPPLPAWEMRENGVPVAHLMLDEVEFELNEPSKEG